MAVDIIKFFTLNQTWIKILFGVLLAIIVAVSMIVLPRYINDSPEIKHFKYLKAVFVTSCVLFLGGGLISFIMIVSSSSKIDEIGYNKSSQIIKSVDKTSLDNIKIEFKDGTKKTFSKNDNVTIVTNEVETTNEKLIGTKKYTYVKYEPNYKYGLTKKDYGFANDFSNQPKDVHLEITEYVEKEDDPDVWIIVM